jgi:hypothetical protein
MNPEKAEEQVLDRDEHRIETGRLPFEHAGEEAADRPGEADDDNEEDGVLQPASGGVL